MSNADNKKYWKDQEIYSGKPGEDIYEALKQFFHDYYTGKDRHEVVLKLNGVSVTMKRI